MNKRVILLISLLFAGYHLVGGDEERYRKIEMGAHDSALQTAELHTLMVGSAGDPVVHRDGDEEQASVARRDTDKSNRLAGCGFFILSCWCWTLLLKRRDYIVTNQTDQKITVTSIGWGREHSATILPHNATSIVYYSPVNKMCAKNLDQHTACATDNAVAAGGRFYVHRVEDSLVITRGAGSTQLPSWNGTDSEYISDETMHGSLRGAIKK